VYLLVRDDLELSDDGQEILNLNAVLKRTKPIAPEFFGRVAGSADGGTGARAAAATHDMNAQIRHMAGRG